MRRRHHVHSRVEPNALIYTGDAQRGARRRRNQPLCAGDALSGVADRGGPAISKRTLRGPLPKHHALDSPRTRQRPERRHAVGRAKRHQFLSTRAGLTELDAYALCSIAVSFRVTQVVDIVRGVHAMIPKSLFLGELRKKIAVV